MREIELAEFKGRIGRIERGLNNKEVVGFYSGTNKKIKDLENRATNETTENITDEEKVFYVKICGKPFNINRYKNLSFSGNQLFTGKTSLKETKDEEKISDLIDQLKQGCPVGDDNKKDVKNLVENAKNIYKTRDDIIQAFKELKTKEGEQFEEHEQTKDKINQLPPWVEVSRERFL